MFILSLLTAALGVLFAFLVGRNAMKIGVTLGLLDHPDGARKIHARATPLVGGFAVAGAAVVAAGLVALLTGDMRLIGLGVAVAMMFLIGAIDDRKHQPPLLRLGAAIAVLLLLLVFAPVFSVGELRFGGISTVWVLPVAAGIAFTLLCLVGLLNAINMADGKNGIVIGFGLIWTVVLAFHAPPLLWPVLAGTGGALVVTLVYNLRGKLFLGDGGSYALSALYGLAAIFAYNAPGATMMAADTAVLFAIPVFDTVRLMVVRASGGRSPLEGDRDHLHHHLYARIGWPRGLLVYMAMIAVPNFGALVWRETGLFWLVVSLVIYILVMGATRFAPASGRPAE
jgi:UDP-GlcNAc:undecaprenyl-phosphate GlcNAc-1-phosphate transferase